MSPFGALIRDRPAMYEIIDRLGNIGRMVADALDILRTEEEMRAKADIARILHHVGEELAEERVVHRIDLLRPCTKHSDARSASRSIKASSTSFSWLERQLAHVLQPQHELLRLLFGHDGDSPLSDVLAKVANPLEIRDDIRKAAMIWRRS